ncbi:Mur ligase middle domain [Propionibacterium ruminifibrarum]|uniref:Lipid II isoglutaminyl synthase (glutamine-hydrolyzing) subunit MurT n=2 Tax=Propionibacterium ruminifibrarum TaxID=1962131 RepID=A0A375I3L2_9ACTN|nr:Mur ligase middle domain [Propionibacterium ruminifibrarum]
MDAMASQPTAQLHHGRPIDPALPRRLWRDAAIGAGNLVAWASRRAGRGSGASIRGQVITRLYPMMFAELVAGRRIAAVSGTNGKTTTTHLLTAAAEAAWGGRQVVTNADGANLREGIASALSQNVKAPVAVLEADEQIVPDLIAKGRPEVLIMLNFSRDQLDRHHEIASLGRKWRTALTAAGEKAPTVVANVHDPLVTWSAEAAGRVIWVDMGLGGWTADAALCPNCGTILAYDADGSWNCPGCELGQHPADYTVRGDEVSGPEGAHWTFDLQVPGRFNRGNATCALAAAIEMGIDPQTALRAMSTVKAPAGRFSIGAFGDNRARLLLAKNPAGWAESLLVMDSDPVVLAIDSAIADGTDVSWLWDVEFEKLAGKHVICTGPRAQDLAVRLSYAEVDHEVIGSINEAMARPYEGTVDVLATYTAFLNLCKMGGVEW